MRPEDVDVVRTHLHLDHRGWLPALAGRPVLPRADLWSGAADWQHVVLDPQRRMRDHIRHGPLHTDAARLHLVDGDTTVVPTSP